MRREYHARRSPVFAPGPAPAERMLILLSLLGRSRCRRAMSCRVKPVIGK